MINIAVQAQKNINWSIKPYVNESQPEYQVNTWVHLLQQPSDYSYEEALLLCQLSAQEWVAWIPDHGEAVLNVRQFCALGEN